jgi:hypothetical protein
VPNRQWTKGSAGPQRVAIRARSIFGASPVVTTSEITLARYHRAPNHPQTAAHTNGMIKRKRAKFVSSEIVLTDGEPVRDMLKIQMPSVEGGATDNSCSLIVSIVIAMRFNSIFCDSHSRRISVIRPCEIRGEEISTCSMLCWVTMR